MRHAVPKAEAAHAMHIFDIKGDGCITAGDLKHFVASKDLPDPLTADEVPDD